MKQRKKLLVTTLALLVISLPNADAATIEDLTHIHNIRILENQILIGTHEGLYQYINKNDIKEVGKERFDIMGLSVLGKTLFASGHPGSDSKLPQPVGLLRSKDGGKNWEKISLQGKVDFHLLELSNTEIYGGDSSSGNLFYSKDLGKNWSNLGKNTFADIAPNPKTLGAALALREGVIFKTSDVFKTIQPLTVKNKISALEWNATRLIAASGKELLISKNLGKSWQSLFKFNDNIGAIAQSKDVIVVAAGASIFISTDSGVSFQSK